LLRHAQRSLAVLILTLSMSLPSYADEQSDPEMPENYDFSSVPALPARVNNQLLALRMFQDSQGEWDWDDWEALLELWDRESRWNEAAANPSSSARGIPQAMTSLHPETQTPEWLSDPSRQISWGMDYIKNRYGRPTRALEHHDLKNWY